MAARKKPVTKKKTSKKKTTKKKAPAKKPIAQKAGAKRPSFKVSGAAAKQSTARKSKFYDLDAGNHVMRILPPFDETRFVPWYKTVLHVSVKAEDSERNMWPACLEEHGDGNCYICNFLEYAATQGDPFTRAAADKMYVSTKYCVQAYIWEVASQKWLGPKIVKLPQGVVNKLSTNISTAEDTGQAPFCDVKRGQSVVISRVGAGKNDTRYDANPTGNMFDLDKEIPGWYEEAYKDLWAALDVNELDINAQKEALYRTYPELPWEDIEKAIG